MNYLHGIYTVISYIYKHHYYIISLIPRSGNTICITVHPQFDICLAGHVKLGQSIHFQSKLNTIFILHDVTLYFKGPFYRAILHPVIGPLFPSENTPKKVLSCIEKLLSQSRLDGRLFIVHYQV